MLEKVCELKRNLIFSENTKMVQMLTFETLADKIRGMYEHFSSKSKLGCNRAQKLGQRAVFD